MGQMCSNKFIKDQSENKSVGNKPATEMLWHWRLTYNWYNRTIYIGTARLMIFGWFCWMPNIIISAKTFKSCVTISREGSSALFLATFFYKAHSLHRGTWANFAVRWFQQPKRYIIKIRHCITLSFGSHLFSDSIAVDTITPVNQKNAFLLISL